MYCSHCTDSGNRYVSSALTLFLWFAPLLFLCPTWRHWLWRWAAKQAKANSNTSHSAPACQVQNKQKLSVILLILHQLVKFETSKSYNTSHSAPACQVQNKQKLTVTLPILHQLVKFNQSDFLKVLFQTTCKTWKVVSFLLKKNHSWNRLQSVVCSTNCVHPQRRVLLGF